MMDVRLPISGGLYSATLVMPCPENAHVDDALFNSAYIEWDLTPEPDGSPRAVVRLPVNHVMHFRKHVIAAWSLFREMTATLPRTECRTLAWQSNPAPYGLAISVGGLYGTGILPFAHAPSDLRFLLQSWQVVEMFLEVVVRAHDAARKIADKVLADFEAELAAPATPAVAASIPMPPDWNPSPPEAATAPSSGVMGVPMPPDWNPAGVLADAALVDL